MLLLLAACAAPDASAPATGATGWPYLEGDCDPLVPEVCGMPFPSDVYLRDDASTVSGKRVAFGETTLPVSDDGLQSSPLRLNASDGFSPAAGPITFLPGATATGFAGPDDPAASLGDTSPTVILDADTGERVAHFAELDMTQDDATRRAILLRPVSLLRHGHRYIVALRGVVDAGGALVPASDTMAALRDGTDSDEPSVGSRRAHYEELFTVLAAAGVARGSVQLAWDFTVASREDATSRLVTMRDVALAEIGDGAPYTLTAIETDPDAWLALHVEGTVRVPLFLDDGGPGGVLTLDEDGVPVQNGTYDYPFVLLVPKSCAGVSCPIVQYGHGLFGDRYSVDQAGYHEAADTFGAVVLSMDWIGMSGADIPMIAAAAAAGDLDQFATIPDRSQQGMVNMAVALRTLMGPMSRDPSLALEGVSAIDPDVRYYIGGSQGGIYGATYMAITPDIERGALVVPGAAYSLMLPRSVYWSSYATPFVVDRYEDPRVVQLVLGYVQMLWDRAEPSGYATAITEDPLPGTPPHRVLLMEGIGDHQVPNLSTELLARSIGAAYLGPPNQELFGLDPVEGPLDSGNVLLDFDYGLPDNPDENVPMEVGDDPHDAVFFEPSAQAALYLFLHEGVALNPCDGPCDPN